MTKQNNIEKRKNPFTVPEGYFDSLPGLIQDKIESNKRSTSPFMWLSKLKWQYKLIATSFLILISVGIVYQLSKTPANNEQYTYGLTWEDIIDNNDNLLVEFDETIIIESLAEETDKNFSIESDISQDDLINFLLEAGDLEDLVYDL